MGITRLARRRKELGGDARAGSRCVPAGLHGTSHGRGRCLPRPTLRRLGRSTMGQGPRAGSGWIDSPSSPSRLAAPAMVAREIGLGKPVTSSGQPRRMRTSPGTRIAPRHSPGRHHRRRLLRVPPDGGRVVLFVSERTLLPAMVPVREVQASVTVPADPGTPLDRGAPVSRRCGGGNDRAVSLPPEVGPSGADDRLLLLAH
jgi:hypothetical protein